MTQQRDVECFKFQFVATVAKKIVWYFFNNQVLFILKSNHSMLFYLSQFQDDDVTSPSEIQQWPSGVWSIS